MHFRKRHKSRREGFGQNSLFNEKCFVIVENLILCLVAAAVVLSVDPFQIHQKYEVKNLKGIFLEKWQIALNILSSTLIHQLGVLICNTFRKKMGRGEKGLRSMY